MRFKKIEMAQVFAPGGEVVPVTTLKTTQSFDGQLKEGDRVLLVGKSKGKGFAGVVKRFGFSGGPKTHGQSDRHRRAGSIGAGTDPGRVWKGKKMAGRMGGKRITIRGLTILEVFSEKGLVKVSGSVPGGRNAQVLVKKT